MYYLIALIVAFNEGGAATANLGAFENLESCQAASIVYQKQASTLSTKVRLICARRA